MNKNVLLIILIVLTAAYAVFNFMGRKSAPTVISAPSIDGPGDTNKPQAVLEEEAASPLKIMDDPIKPKEIILNVPEKEKVKAEKLEPVYEAPIQNEVLPM